MIHRQITDPRILVNGTVTEVVTKSYYDPNEDGYEEVTITLADGRRFELTSCSCCGGASFSELVEDEE